MRASPLPVAEAEDTPGPGIGTQVVCYTFTYTQPYLTPIAAAITGDLSMVHSVAVTVLNEPFPSN